MKIRKGTKKDIPRALELIIELASYEKSEGKVMTTVESMEEDAFGATPIFEFYVAENSESIIGLALFYYRYSTWKGRRLYLEDLVVTKKERGKSIGKLLLNELITHAKHHNCSGISWQVLDWNESAIQFYKKTYNASIDGEWLNCSIET
ncbi:MAG: GNAT family N-acetyltransferase [Cyclobacteriaceae bacterium]|nr:GNAT family N-acetyltransferase [Cyclobacteriaceae bacterium]